MFEFFFWLVFLLDVCFSWLCFVYPGEPLFHGQVDDYGSKDEEEEPVKPEIYGWGEWCGVVGGWEKEALGHHA